MPHIKSLLASKTVLTLAIVYSCVITVLFFIPGSDLPEVSFSAADKLMHTAIYVLLIGIWQLYFFVRNGYRFKLRWAIVILLACLFYGIIIEILQGSFTVSRSADIYDVLANLIGLILGIFIFKKVKHIFNP